MFRVRVAVICFRGAELLVSGSFADDCICSGLVLRTQHACKYRGFMFWLGCGPAGTCEPNMRFFKATKAGAATERLDQNFISDMSLATGRQDPFTHESPRANPSKAVVYPRKFQRTPELSAFKLPVVQIVAEWLLLLLSWMYEHAGDTDVQPCGDFQKVVNWFRVGTGHRRDYAWGSEVEKS